MGWNYRVVKQDFPDGLGGIETFYSIHEAYYKTKRSKKPYLISKDPMEPYGSTPEELANCLERMKEALKKPIIVYEDFCK